MTMSNGGRRDVRVRWFGYVAMLSLKRARRLRRAGDDAMAIVTAWKNGVNTPLLSLRNACNP